MHRHGPDGLEGPVTRNRLRWLALTGEGPPEVPEVPSRPGPSREEPPLRWHLIERVRREIAEGVYDTPQKWEEALDRLLDQLQRE